MDTTSSQTGMPVWAALWVVRFCFGHDMKEDTGLGLTFCESDVSSDWNVS